MKTELTLILAATAAAVVPACGCLAASPAALYTRNSSALYSLNPSNGNASLIGFSNQNESVEDLTSRAAEQDILYGAENQGNLNPGVKLVKINRHTGAQLDGPLFDESALGFPGPFATGIAISPANPAVAIVTGFDAAGPFLFPSSPSPTYGQQFIWKIDVATGIVISPGVETQRIGPLTFNRDGSLLYSVDSDGRLVTVDPNSGAITLIGDPGLTNFIEGLAFRPNDGRLFAIDGGTSDDLVVLDPATGAFVGKVGDLTLGGAHGLAFNLPEPSAIILFALVSSGILFLRRR
jgi:hypothetical protein